MPAGHRCGKMAHARVCMPPCAAQHAPAHLGSMAAQGKCNGNQIVHDYLEDVYLQKLEPVVQALAAEPSLKDAKYDARTLGLLIHQFLQFMEDALGKNVSLLSSSA